MDNFLSVLITELTPQTFFGCIGGILGGMFAMLLDNRFNLKIKTILIIIAMFAGGAIADYLHSNKEIHSLFGLGFLGSITGVASCFIPEVVRLVFPKFFEKLLNKYGDSLINKI